jgi:hypothetical protein
MRSIQLLTALVLALPVTVAPQAKAATIPVTYSLSGGPTGPPVMSGSTLVLDGLFTGSFTSGNPSLDNVWNPLTYQDHSVIDLTTGLLHGSFSVVFKDGDTLTGNVFEDVSAVLANNGMGPFTQTLTFTGGTGQFLGATGQLSGSGNTAGTAPVTGRGAINAPAIPEPSTILLSAAGFAIVLVCGRAGRLKG